MIDLNSIEMHGTDVKDKAVKLREQACNNYEDFIKSISIAFPEDYYGLGEKDYVGTTASRRAWDDARNSFLLSHTDGAWWLDQSIFRGFGESEWWETQLLNEMSKTEIMTYSEFLRGCNNIFNYIDQVDRNPDYIGDAFSAWEESFNRILNTLNLFGIVCRVDWEEMDDSTMMPEIISVATEQWLLQWIPESDGTWTRYLCDNTYDSFASRAKRLHNPSHTISIRQGLKTYFGTGRRGYDD